MIAPKHILVPVDFGESSGHALDWAIDLAKQSGASLTLVHAWEFPVYAYSGLSMAPADLLGPVEQAASKMLEAEVARARAQVANVTGVLEQGSAWREILATIEEKKPDLVVMGTHGRHGVSRVLLGSVAEKIVRLSPTTVVIVRK